MSFSTNLSNLAARIAAECKALRTLVNGNGGDLSGLATSAKENLVAAINEVHASLASAGGGIKDDATSAATTWSSQKIPAEIDGCRPAGATNAVQIKGPGGRLAASETFVFDPASKSLGLGTSVPSARLHAQASVGETRDLVQASDAAGKKLVRVTRDGLLAIGDDRDAVYKFVPNAPLDINDARGMTLRNGYGTSGLGFNFRTDSYLYIKRTDSAANEEFYIGPSEKGAVAMGGSGNFLLQTSTGFISLIPSAGGGEGTLFVGRRGDRAATSGVHAEFWGSTLGNNGIIVTKSPGGLASLFSTYRDGTTDITVNSPSAVPLTLKGAASQTADLQRWAGASGAVVHAITADGTIDFMGEASPPASNAAPVKWVKVQIAGTPYRLPLYQ